MAEWTEKDAWGLAFMDAVKHACEIAVEMGAKPKSQEMHALVGALLMQMAIHRGEKLMEKHSDEFGICKKDPRQAGGEVPGACGCASEDGAQGQ